MAILNLTVYSTQLMEIEENSSRPGREKAVWRRANRDLAQRLKLANL